jgi:hypothetical protein
MFKFIITIYCIPTYTYIRLTRGVPTVSGLDMSPQGACSNRWNSGRNGVGTDDKGLRV